MAKNIEKNKVGRPKLADSELIKSSLYKVAICFVMVAVLIVGGIYSLCKPSLNNLKGNVVEANSNVGIKRIRKVTNNNSVKRIRVISAKKSPKRIIHSDGTVTKIIPVE